jgi:hypothetical protein
MIEPRLSVMRLAKALVDAGSVRDTGAASAMIRLHASLAKLIGQGGFDVLLRRSLALARREHELLVGVVVGPRGELTGLNDPSRDLEAIEQAEVAIVAHFIELLVVLIGEELAMRLLDEVRQEAMNGAQAQAKEEKE